MSSEPVRSGPPASIPDDYEVIHRGDDEAIVVPLDRYRALEALEQAATPEALEEAEGAFLSARMDEWVANGRPGAKSHDEVMAELFGNAE